MKEPVGLKRYRVNRNVIEVYKELATQSKEETCGANTPYTSRKYFKKYSLKSKENFNKTVFKSRECCFAEHTIFSWYAQLLGEWILFKFK